MVSAIPEGVSSVVPYLCIRGAKKAIDFYQAAFGAEVVSVMPMGPDLIGHADLRIAGSRVYLSDEMPQFGAVKSPSTLKGSSANIHLWVEDCDAVFARAVAAGAKPIMPLVDQFWGDRYGMVADPFGHLWAISTHKEDLTPEEMMRRGEEAMAKMPPPPPPAPKPRPKPKAAKKGLPPRLKPKPALRKEPKPEAKVSVAPKPAPAPSMPEGAEAKKAKKDKKGKKGKKEKKAKKDKTGKKSKKDKKRKKKSKR